MGSFNASCAVSKCSINPGDRVKLIPIVSNTSLHREYETQMHVGFGCYTWDYFSVIGYPMNATYEDYGNFEVEDNYISQYNLSIIKKNYTQTPIPAGEDEPSSIRFDREGYNVTADMLDWEIIGNMIHYGSLFLDSNTDLSRRRFVGYFPVHESVYNLFMDCTPEMHFDSTYCNVPFVKYLNKMIQNCSDGHTSEYEAALLKYMDIFSTNIGGTDSDGNIVTPETALEGATEMAELVSQSSEKDKAFSYHNTSHVRRIFRFIENDLKTVIDEKIKHDIIVADAELDFVIRGLGGYNIPLLPPMTAGQDYDKTDHAAFLIRMGQEMMKLQTSVNEENYDEDELVLKPVLNNHFEVSLAGLITGAENDWKPERGKENLVLIEKFIAEYPEGVYLTTAELQKNGYISILSNVESTMLDFLFINDTVKE